MMFYLLEHLLFIPVTISTVFNGSVQRSFACNLEKYSCTLLSLSLLQDGPHQPHVTRGPYYLIKFIVHTEP